MICSFISSAKGGGAEHLTKSLHRLNNAAGYTVQTFYFHGKDVDLIDGEHILNFKPRNPFNIFKIRYLLKNLLNKHEKIIVHVHLTWPLYYVTLASIGLKGIVLVYTEHNTNNKRRKIPFLYIFERYLYGKFAKIICISDGVRSSLINWIGQDFNERLITIHNGSTLYDFKNRKYIKEKKLMLVSVGSLNYKKNFLTSIKSISLIKSKIKNYTIVGEGPERSKLESAIKQLNLQDIVKLVGWDDSVEKYLHNADIQLIPSLYEGFGLVAVEGMSTGLPIIASKVDGLCEVLGHDTLSVFYVERTTDHYEWSQKILLCIDALHKDSRSIAYASRTRAKKFSLDKMALSYRDLYDTLT